MVYLILLICFIFFILAYKFTGFAFKKLPVLMYHKVTDFGAPDNLTVTTRQLDKQFRYLIKKKYTPILLSDLIDHVNGQKKLPPKPVLLTFDDGYKNNYTCLYPLLKKFGMKANIFLVAGFIQAPDSTFPQNKFLHVDDTRQMSGDTVQFGLHSYDHKSYNDLTIPQIDEDIQKCRARLNHLEIPFEPCLAYPYGAYPKRDAKKRNQLFSMLQSNGIKLAFRIGNRVNVFPLKNGLLVQRLDIRGDESFNRFKFILIAGKKMLFK